MKPLLLANRYMEIFYGGGPIDSLKDLLADNFEFKGPFYEFHSAAEYIASLKSDPPPQAVKYTLIQAYENETSACLVYQFSKRGVSTPMAQTFQVANEKITNILLVFDTAAFNI